MRYLLLKVAEGDSDPHVLPQYLVCPFCTYNFTVYARLENNAEDMSYFLLKTGLA